MTRCTFTAGPYNLVSFGQAQLGGVGAGAAPFTPRAHRPLEPLQQHQHPLVACHPVSRLAFPQHALRLSCRCRSHHPELICSVAAVCAAARSPTKEHTRSQSSSDTSHPRHSLPDSPEMRSAHRRHLPPPLTGASGGGLDGTLLDMHSAVGAGPTSAFSAAFAAHMEPLQAGHSSPAVMLLKCMNICSSALYCITDSVTAGVTSALVVHGLHLKLW